MLLLTLFSILVNIFWVPQVRNLGIIFDSYSFLNFIINQIAILPFYFQNIFWIHSFHNTSILPPCPQSVVMWIVQWTRASSQGMSLSDNLAYIISAILVLDYVFLAEGIFFLGTRFLARLALKGSPFPNCTKTGYLTPSITLVKLPSFLSQTTIIAL